MLRLLSWLVGIGLIALVLFLFFGSQFFKNAGNALINAINGSAAHGVAQIIPNTSGNTTDLQVNLQGLAPKATYDVTLDQNACGGPLIQDAGTVTTDASGNVTKTFMVSDVSKLAQQTLWVDVHKGPDRSSQSVACGQVQLNSTSQANLTNSNSSSNSATISQINLDSSDNSSTSSSTVVVNVPSVNVPSGVSNSGSGNQNPSNTGLPNSGVAPGGSNSYDNYTFPRKY